MSQNGNRAITFKKKIPIFVENPEFIINLRKSKTTFFNVNPANIIL
jgi:hypothetical protein